VFDMYGDSRDKLLEILAVVIISSPISFVCGCQKSALNDILKYTCVYTCVCILKSQLVTKYHMNDSRADF